MPEQKNTTPPLQGEGAVQQLTPQERTSRLIELTVQFGSAANIPQDTLAAIGYIRKIGDDGSVSLSPLDLLQEREVKMLERQEKLRQKIENTPFSRIHIPLEGSSSAFRFLHSHDLPELRKRLENFEDSIYPIDNPQDDIDIVREIIPQSPVQDMLIEVSKFLKQELVEKEGMEYRQVERIESLLFFSPLYHIGSFARTVFPDSNKFLADRVDSENQLLNSKATERMYFDLERMKGRVTDITELENALNSLLDSHYEKIIPDSGDSKLIEYFNANHLTSVRDIAIHFIQGYLKTVLPQEVVDKLQRTESFKEKAQIIKNARINEDLKKEETTLNARIKTASLEEKRELSTKLKELKERIRKRARIQIGAADYFSLPEVLAEVYGRKIGDIQSLLANAGQKGLREYAFDPIPDPEGDKNPGVISGDCTVGSPLPFDDPDIPLYNVKVLNPEGIHQGNMYLLVTNEYDKTKTRVWHFDAIQLPNPGIDWQDAIKEIIKQLGDQAKRKGVNMITVNDNDAHISNYDYISREVRKYWQDFAGGKKTTVQLLRKRIDTEKYTNLQGSGDALILWENKP